MDIQTKMKLFYDNPVVSWHEHCTGINEDNNRPDFEHAENQVALMDSLGVDISVISRPLSTDPHCPPEEFRQANRLIYEIVKRFPGRYYGMAFLNPGFQKEALAELERCVTEYGFVGVKLYHQYFMDNPVQYPLIEKCIELDVPILIHSGHVMDPATRASQPRISDGVHMANAARKYPEATFVMGHIGGGGDWQWSIKAIADCPNVYADMGGSVHDRPLMEESVKYLGAERILFSTDGSWGSGVGKILGAEVSEEEKKTILAGTAFRKYLERTGK